MREPLERLQALYAGRIYERARRPGNRQVWVWEIHGGKGVRACLEAILPYLVVKREQADILLAYTCAMRPPGGQARLTDAELAERDVIVARLVECKSRGRG